MDNNFDEREYSTSSKDEKDTISEESNEIVLRSKETRKDKRSFSSSFVICLVIICFVCSSVFGSAITLYLAPKFAFFQKTPLYSQIGVSKTQYIGPTYFSEDKDVLSVTEIVKRVGPAVVGVSTKSIVNRGFFGLQQQEGIGSGFIINEEGHILTNYHVVEGVQTVKIIFYDGVETDGKVINYDELNDIALIKLTDPTVMVPATVSLGNSDELLVGESVVAIGSPLGKEFIGTTTKGIVSALDRDITIDGKTLKLLQTDTAINPGNSGGPLINSRGEVIGINTAKFDNTGTTSVEGIGFAIPINQAKQKLDELSKPILRIGIKGRVIDQSMSNNLNLPQGIYVVEVESFSNAERAGIKSGDVILKFGGRDVKTFEDINSVKVNHNAGDTIRVVVYRNGANQDIDLILNE
ncbi:S1C family serine protease [Candidatus Arthromitus sp. SFB-rat-Yit]|uniref:S1C family serine protease n=1 Tax=Candidatus Arthromitus sp. SFB-rat-Yit TaxID=1041504 RepID=UPI000227A25C|nr:trypsin-like peptidase domain-containing protein [Candidatus Arthromitus sp. SFB-rat-Yit]BAK80778.1 putative serine protease [Candidatus Arthromitus sp. SFB-rat-Yit]